MRVILNTDIQNLGEEGDIKNVANGYAMNYLLPKKLAMAYTKQNLHILEQKKELIEKRKEEKRKDAMDIKDKLEAEELNFSMPAGKSGKLFGSVNNALIAEELEKRGYHIEKKRIEIPGHSIRMVGEFNIKVRLYEHKEAALKINIESLEEKAD